MISSAKDRQILIYGAAAGGGITALTGDVTATGPGSATATLSTTGVVAGTYGSSSLVPVITVDAKGRLTTVTTAAITPYSPPTYTQGSVLFAGVTGAPTQDNTNFFFNDTTDQLKVAGSVLSPLHIGGTGTTDDLTLQATSGVGTTGSWIFFKVGNNGAITTMEMNHLGWVGIGTTGIVSLSSALHVRQANPPDIGYVADFRSNLSCYVAVKTGVGANEQAGFTFFQTNNAIEWRMAVTGNEGNSMRWTAIDSSGSPFTRNVMYVTTRGNIILSDSYNKEPTTGSKGLILGDGTALATMASDTCGIYGDDVGGTVNLFAINEAGNTSKLTGFTTGSVIFAVTATGFTESNADFFWDNSNKRLGIGTVTPAVPLHIVGGLLQIDVYGSGTSGFVARSAGGTVGSPSQTAINTVISSFVGRAYTDAGAFTGNIGSVNIVMVVAPTAADQETTIQLRCVPSGSTTNTTIFQCYGDQAVVSIGFLAFNTRNSATSVALKRSTTVLQTKLADDSAFAQHSALEFMSNRANFLSRGAVALTDGAGALTGTLTNSPKTGNPTKWLAYDDAGTTRYIPAW